MRQYLIVLFIYGLLVLTAYMLVAPHLTKSAMLGVMACFIPNAWLYARVNGLDPHNVVTWIQGFKRAETVKFLFTVVFFGAMFKFAPNLSMITVIANYAVAIAVDVLIARRLATTH